MFLFASAGAHPDGHGPERRGVRGDVPAGAAACPPARGVQPGAALAGNPARPGRPPHLRPRAGAGAVRRLPAGARPIGRRKRGYILTTDQSLAHGKPAVRYILTDRRGGPRSATNRTQQAGSTRTP
eukprot:9479175-Pyramimonas_sp.AAC.2